MRRSEMLGWAIVMGSMTAINIATESYGWAFFTGAFTIYDLYLYFKGE